MLNFIILFFLKVFIILLNFFFKKDSTYPSYNYITGLEYKLLSLINLFFLKKNKHYYPQNLKLNKFKLTYFNSIRISTLPFLKKKF